MRSLLLLFFLTLPFWEAKPPERWTDAQVYAMRHSSPWTQSVGPAPEVAVWLATAKPIGEAEIEARRRARSREQESDPDYTDYLAEHGPEVLVLAVGYPTLKDLGNAREDRKLEDEAVMKIGRKSYHILGYFPPTPSDPVLRLVFPRAVKNIDKQVEFELYLSGLPFPERQLTFDVKDLIYHGKLAM